MLRLDGILWDWAEHWQCLAEQGYSVDAQATGKSVAEVRRFIADWYHRMRPVYMALVRDGRGITRQTLQRDVNRLFRGNFEKWTNLVA